MIRASRLAPVLLALVASAASFSASAATVNSPLGVMRSEGLIHNVQFQDQRANYSVWRFRGSGQANMQGLFLSAGRSRGGTELVKTVQLSLASPTQTFRKTQVQTLQKAAEAVSSQCFQNDLINLDLFMQNALDSKSAVAVSRGRTTEITIVPAGEGWRMTVELRLPAGKTAQCRMPRA